MEELKEQFELLKRIVTPAGERADLPVEISKLEKIIKEKIPIALEKQAPPNFPELYFDFQQVYERFHDFLLFDRLIGKNIIALGGGFSSGKSSFLNSLLGKLVLPANIDPSTSVPTYVIYGDEESAFGINEFDVKLPLSFADIKSIAHGFGAVEDENGDVVSAEGITLGHLLQSCFVAAPSLPFSSLAFLDTPGYSNPETKKYSIRTDERIARIQLNSSNYIMWCVPADAGTISADDIAFLSELDKNIPKLIIITKADKFHNDEELQSMKSQIMKTLDIKGIKYTDVLAVSRRGEYDKAAVEAVLQKLNKSKMEADFAHSFKKLFVACKDFYDTEVNEANIRLERLNKVLTLAGDQSEVENYLAELVKDIKDELKQLKEAKQCLHDLQQEFFTEIKFVADKVNITMPEPSEIDLLEDQKTDAAAIAKTLLQPGTEKLRKTLLQSIEKSMEEMSPSLHGQRGDEGRKQVLYEMIKEAMG